jgi:hypothetical protein
MARNKGSIPVGGALVRFGFAFVALHVLLVAVFTLMGSTVNVGLSLGALIGAAIFAGQGFVKTHGRMPNDWETAKLVAGSLVVSLAAGFAMGAVASLLMTGSLDRLTAIFGGMLERFPSSYIAFGFLMIIAIYAILLRLSYGALLRVIAGWRNSGPPRHE